MRLELGSPVRCEDAPFGELADIVVDPTRQCVTHLVVEPHHRHHLARLVPVELAAVGNGGPALALRCTVAEVRRLAPVQEFAFLRLGEFPVDDPEWDVGTRDVLALPYYDYEWMGAPTPYDAHASLVYDRIPKGEVEIRRASVVVSADGHRLGHVDGLLVEADEHITHVVLERGHLWGRREVTIPIGAVAKVETDSVTLDLTKDQVAGLSAVPVRRPPR
jgi:sporulation protein YlmC with PRC-barrel domain